MRRLFTTAQARNAGITESALRWGERTGQWRRIVHGVYGEGPARPTVFDVELARVLAQERNAARGHLAGVLHGLDSVAFRAGRRARRPLPPERIVMVRGIRCANGLQTMLDLGSTLDDDRWEQALESALRKRLTSIAEIESGLTRVPGTARIRRVVARRPAGAPPTESLLETLMVQLARGVVPEPVRQLAVVDEDGTFVARLDLAWPDLGFFAELDGEGHVDQPVYDAWRQTAVSAATGWLVGRFTWQHVTRNPNATRRRLAQLAERAVSRGSLLGLGTRRPGP